MLVMLVGVFLAPGDPVNGGTPVIGGIIDIIPRLGIFQNLQGPPELGVLLLPPALLFLLIFVVQQARGVARLRLEARAGDGGLA